MPAIGDDREIVARKEHCCDLCGLRIRKGARYWLREGVEGREHWRMRMHAVCRHAAEAWRLDDWDDWQQSSDDGTMFAESIGLTPAGLLNLGAEILRGARQ